MAYSFVRDQSDFPDFMENMTDIECHEETIRLALIDQGCSAFELPDMMEQLVAENLDPSDIEARILQLGWGDDETFEEFLEGQRRANMGLHALYPSDLEPTSIPTTRRTRVYLDRKCKKTS